MVFTGTDELRGRRPKRQGIESFVLKLWCIVTNGNKVQRLSRFGNFENSRTQFDQTLAVQLTLARHKVIRSCF
jgi:hypothetical protein